LRKALHPERETDMVASSDLKKTKRLLFVEDHDLFRTAFALLLEWHMNLDSVQVKSLTEARRALSSLEEVDLAIVDIDLPHGEGLHLVKELSEDQPDVPVLALTVSRSLERRTSALDAGADEVLTLSTAAEEIICAVRRLGAGSRKEPMN
jgi:DNA-binding NarL/FixJ family response regulator